MYTFIAVCKNNKVTVKLNTNLNDKEIVALLYTTMLQITKQQFLETNIDCYECDNIYYDDNNNYKFYISKDEKLIICTNTKAQTQMVFVK